MDDSEPIGLAVTRTGRILNREFDDALAAVGGSLPVWLIVTALKRGEHSTQRDIAASVGIEDATLTHHLNRMEHADLIERHRASTNRRVQVVTLTPAGEALFVRMLTTVKGFDERLRHGLSNDRLAELRTTLALLRANVSGGVVEG